MALIVIGAVVGAALGAVANGLYKYFSKRNRDNKGPYLEYDQIKQKLKKGDLIEIDRNILGMHYQHWVLFEKIDEDGNVWCFHATGSKNDPWEFINGYVHIRYEPLLKILKENNFGKQSLSRINNQTNMAEKKLKETKTKQPDIEQVFKKLHNMKNKKVSYSVKSCNCEHYVTSWKYDVPWSTQIEILQKIGINLKNKCKDYSDKNKSSRTESEYIVDVSEVKSLRKEDSFKEELDKLKNEKVFDKLHKEEKFETQNRWKDYKYENISSRAEIESKTSSFPSSQPKLYPDLPIVYDKYPNLRSLPAQRDVTNDKVRELQSLEEQDSNVGEVVKPKDKEKVSVIKVSDYTYSTTSGKEHPKEKFDYNRR